MTAIGLDFNLSKEFVALTISAFALTTLDTATRLGRFIFQEMVTTKAGANSPLGKAVSNRYVATGITIALAWIMSTGSYLTIWPIFGTANQMLAALALLAIAAWLKKSKRNHLMITIPMYFMFAVTFCSLGQLIYANLGKNWLIVGVSTVLAVLSAALAVEAFRVFGEENRINASAQAQNQQ